MSNTKKAPDPCEPRTWDARWNGDQRQEALQLAHEALHDTSCELNRALREVDTCAKRLQQDAEWVGTAAYFKAEADAREAVMTRDETK